MIHLKKHHYLFLATLIVLGVALALVSFVSFDNFEHEKLAANLKEKSEDRIFTFQDIIDDSIEEIISLGAFFNASEKVERQEFHDFSQSILSRQPGLKALEWIPRVADSERDLYEETAIREGYANFRITERVEQGSMIPAQKREEYFPAFYVEPLAGNELALGYDLGSNPLRRKSLQMSRDSGKVIATPRITLVQEMEEHFAFLVFLPIYKNGGLSKKSVEERRNAFSGFVLGVFQVQEMLEEALALLTPQGIDLFIFDKTERDPDRRFLGFYASRIRNGPFEFEPDEKKIAQGYYYSLDVSIADRTWTVYCVPTAEFLLQSRHWQVWGVPGFTLFFVVVVIGCLVIFLDRAEKIKQHASELSEAKDVLEDEILERQRSEKEKANLEIQLRHAHKLESIGTLAGGIAHDFNNILTIIVGNIELAKIKLPDDSPVHANLRKVVDASKRAKGLVSQILSFSRKVDQDRQPVKPHLIVKETINMLRSTIPATIEIQEDIDQECGTIIVDPTQIDQILINLCTNGVHAMHEKGVLRVSLKEIFLNDKDLAHRPDMEPDLYVELSISDTGTGIDPDILERVFDPFFTTKEVGKGTGMGLSMVHGIVLSNRGMITVNSEPGRGSRFQVYFPVVESEESELEEIQMELPTGTERILLVDDEPEIIELGRNILEQQGFHMTCKVSSQEALEYIRSGQDTIDLLITDQTMPKMSGTELTVEVKKIRPDLPVILCTGFSTKVSSKEEATKLGIAEFIMKPFDRPDLVNMVRKVLDEKQSTEI